MNDIITSQEMADNTDFFDPRKYRRFFTPDNEPVYVPISYDTIVSDQYSSGLNEEYNQEHIQGDHASLEEESSVDLKNRMLVNTAGLMKLLSCGRPMAQKVGTEAGAKVCLGRKVFWNTTVVQRYLDSVTEDGILLV